MTLIDEELEKLTERWRRAVAKDSRPRLLTPLPLRTRLRLAAQYAINAAGCWLCDHGHCTAAKRLWQACGMW